VRLRNHIARLFADLQAAQPVFLSLSVLALLEMTLSSNQQQAGILVGVQETLSQMERLFSPFLGLFQSTLMPADTPDLAMDQTSSLCSIPSRYCRPNRNWRIAWSQSPRSIRITPISRLNSAI